MNGEYLILTPINLDSIGKKNFRYLTINLVPEESLADEFHNFRHYLQNINECDPKLIEDTYLDLLSRIAQNLNSMHSINLTEKQWETILGYWLINIISGISERWQTLERIEQSRESKIVCLGGYDSDFSPRFESMESKSFSESHEFNSFVYQQLLRYFPTVSWRQFPSPKVEPRSKADLKSSNFQPKLNLKIRTKQILKYPLQVLIRNFKLKPKVFLVANWIPRVNYFLISVLTRKFIFSSETLISRIENYCAKSETPNWLFARDNDSSFTKACIEIVNNTIPKSLTGDFREIIRNIEKEGLDYYPKVVISNQHHCTGNDAQRIWFGFFGNKNNQLSIIQHGGAYGCYKFHWSAFVETRISSVFMSWGWSALDQSETRNINVPALRLMMNQKDAQVRERTEEKLLFLLCPEPGYNSLFLPSQPYGSNEYLRYLYGIHELMQTVSLTGDAEFYFRRQNQKNFLTSVFFDNFHPEVREDNTPLLVFENWDLIISTYNGTNSLESLLSGVPCIFFWDQHYSSFTELSAPLFKRLEEVGVLHFSAHSAKVVMEMDHSSRKAWWESSEVTEAVSDFLRFFGRTSGGNTGFSKILSRQINSLTSKIM
jgi:putative transferase (TIGR04331 family)